MDTKTTAFIFPGQGSQTLGMGRDLAAAFPLARQTFEEADDLLGFPLSKIMWDGPADELNDTVNTQPALYVHSLAAWRVLSLRHSDPSTGFPEERWDFAGQASPAALAGHSLGELSALAASGALTFADGLRLVRMRGQLMKRAGELAPGGMAAILNLGIPALEKICAEASREGEPVQVANDNCPGQVVISGAKPAVERAMELAKAAGAKRALPLAVSIAAHSSLMNSIQAEWDAAVDAAALSDASAPIFGNVAARALTSADDLRADIRAQMQARVRWSESVQGMIRNGISRFVEVGSGSVLVGLVKRIDSSVTGQALGNPSDFEAL